jgi:putative ABC transport system substrate-binding protein
MSRVLLAIAAFLVMPALVQAQAGTARIGVLDFQQTPESFKAAFRAGLRDQGYTEGKNVVIDWRSADGKVERANQIAAEFVAMKVDVIVASLTPGVQAAKSATSTIPIVMAPAGDPLATGFVASLAHPGGNITGVTNVIVDVGGKLLGLIREIQPNVTRVAVLLDLRTAIYQPFLDDVQAAAGKSGVRVVPVPMKTPQDAAQAFKVVQKERAQALIVMPLVATKEVADLAQQHRIPSISTGISSRLFPKAGGLLGYGVEPNQLYRRAATYVAKILRGAKPGDLPVEQVTTFELIINVKTAKALGLSIPKDMLVRANEVIEQ